ncbi:hypothetical protein HRW16_03805 [Streptomyces lunaelactis]|uniref:hypothetical protein n=1 Tax=Streptomyces lunaelactis TaxID=1535768 RepID=UPI0015846527|nr:hypothetical protein [Streptomyces lunaelactis]NUK33768.1 hypothetical protein [Streptomyces lunaelactis]NUK44525.1 hypothetical protein [Streptomyces lunaelactis]NUK91001.1 hypothetical protein [Streptomyces lunaelactis]NUL29113.1 hypothetical protein [Streptomyces lunaelactis]
MAGRQVQPGVIVICLALSTATVTVKLYVPTALNRSLGTYGRWTRSWDRLRLPESAPGGTLSVHLAGLCRVIILGAAARRFTRWAATGLPDFGSSTAPRLQGITIRTSGNRHLSGLLAYAK